MTKAAKTAKKGKIAKEKVVRRSAADFFQDNKAIAGFDNTMRVVFTSVRELVENGLDAAERIENLPELHVSIQRLKKEEIAKLLNISTFESDEKVDFIRLTVRDNGSGVQSEFVPPLFGRVLTGSNYGARQSRGRFGLGAKMVLLNAMSSVDLPLIIKSKYVDENFTSYHELMINLAENEPIILTKREIPQGTTDAIPSSGTEVTVTFTGSWTLASRWVREYFSQLSLITPYASFYVQYPDNDEPIAMERVVEEMPSYPQIAKVHPWGTDITQFKRELAVTRSESMETFLQDHFQGIGPKTAQKFLEFVKINSAKNPSTLSASDIRRIIHEGFVMPDSDPKKRREQKYFPFRRPSGDSLAPLGWELLAKGIEKELNPQFVRAAAGDVSAYSGHPFIVEAALAYGGPILSSESGNPKIYRFANRIPLLFGAGNDIISKCVQKMAWKNYKIKINKSPIAIVVSIVSSKIPFPETSKEYIADVDELRKQIMKVLKKLARGLKKHLGRAERERRERQRQSRFESAAPKVLRNLSKVLDITETPFLLQSSEEMAKLEKALASAVPRLVRRTFPPSPLISSIGEWLPTSIYMTLVERDIQTIYQFLRAPTAELSNITGLTEERIVEIKCATVNSQERSNKAPSMRKFDIFPKIIEDDFRKYRGGALRIHKALNKRWIVSSLDFFATPISQLRLVENFPEKLIYEAKQKAINEYLTDYPENSFSFQTIPWTTEEIIKGLKSTKIHNVLDYLIAFPEKIAEVPNLPTKLIGSIKKEVRAGIKQGYVDPDKIIGAATFDWMDYRVTPRLRGRKISKIMEFLQTPTEKLIDISELIENLILRSKKVQGKGLVQLNEENPFLKIPALNKSMQPDLERLEIKGFIDFLLMEEKELKIIRGFVSRLISLKQDEIQEQIEQEHDIFPTKAAWWLDSELETKLKSLGIETVHDFIRCPSSTLMKLKELDPQILETIKRTYGTPVPLLTPEEHEKLEKNKVLCLEELQVAATEFELKPKTFHNRIEDLLTLLNSPICYLPIPSKYYHTLHHLGVSRIIDFLLWPDTDLHRKTGMSYKLIEKTKSKISTEEIKSLIDSKTLPVSILEDNLEGKTRKKIVQADLSIQELYYSLPYSNDKVNKLKLSKREVEQLNTLFLTPVSRIPQIKPIWIARLHANDINSFIDLISWSKTEIANIIGRDEKFVKTLLSSFKSFLSGMALIDLGVLSATEMKSLISKGFSTVESLYFCARKNTFGVMGVKWKKIERFQRILETPVAMLQLRSSSDKSAIRISHDGLERLADNGIDQIIKLIYWPPKELKSILKMSLSRIDELKQSVAIKEHGMPLEEVCGYNRKTISTLLGYGIETVEDLYFTASEDMLDEDDELDWSYVTKAIESLELPVTYLTGVIAAKYIDGLVKKQIDTIIRFLITSEKELSETLETPQENVANLRRKVNLIQLRESTETSVSILEGLSRKQLQILADDQISTIFEILTTPEEQIANILEIDTKQVGAMRNDLNFTNIKSMKEEKMIPLTKVSLFNKRTAKKLNRLGIESLADLYYVATPKTFLESDIDWQEIIEVKTILDLPIKISPILRKEELNSLQKAKIQTVLDLMMESQEELEKRTQIQANRIETIQDSINISAVITLLKRLAIDKLNFPSDYLAILQRAEIQTVFELLTHPKEDIYLLKEGDKKIRIDGERWKRLISIMAVPLSLVLGSDREDVKNLKRKRIKTLQEVYSTPSDRLEAILGADPSEFLEELRTLNFYEIEQFLNIPICFIPNITLDWILILTEYSLNHVGDLLNKSTKELAKIVGSTSPKTRALVNKIRMSEVIKNLEDETISLDSFSDIIPTKVISDLDKKNITSIQELILHDREEFELKKMEKIFDVLDSPISRISEELPLNDLRKLSQSGVSTISDWLFTPNGILAKLLGVSISEIKRMKTRFDFEAADEITEADTPLQSFIESGYIDFKETEEHGIHVLEDLLFIDLTTISASDQLKSRLANLKEALNSSLAYYSLLPPQYVTPLAFNGITSVTQLIKTEFSQLEDLMGIIEEEEYNSARSSINLVDIITHKKADTEFRVKLSTLRAFTKRQLGKITNLGVDNVVDLYFRLDTERLTKSLVKPVEKVKRVLEKPVAILPNVQENFPQKIPLLYNAGITSIIEFLFWPKDDLADLLEIKRYEISKYRKINLGSLKRKKNLGTPIENFVRIPEDSIATLHEMGIENIEDLYFHLKRHNFIPEEYVPSKLIKACIHDLESPIVRLAGLPIPVAQELVKMGMTRIIDFLYWPEDDLKQVYGLSGAKIKRIKANVRLRRKADVVGRLDAYMTKD